METTTIELLALPYRCGGYGIPNLALNQEIPLPPSAQIIAARDSCRADISNIDAKIAVEFLGKHDHEGNGALDKDRRRTNALLSIGYEVIELTNEQVHDFKTMEHLAIHTAKRLGKRIEKQYLGTTPARMKLRKELFRWNTANGRPGTPVLPNRFF